MSLAIFEKRENMGASPLAIEYAEHVRKDLALLAPELHPIAIASLIDAAIRKSGAPELLTAVEALLPLADRLNAAEYPDRPPTGADWSTDWKEQVDARLAVAYARRPMP